MNVFCIPTLFNQAFYSQSCVDVYIHLSLYDAQQIVNYLFTLNDRELYQFTICRNHDNLPCVMDISRFGSFVPRPREFFSAHG